MPFLSEKVSYCKIFPPIGISRLGNSENEYFIGPEHPDILPTPADGKYKDSKGRIKRQAARFRVYAFDENNNVLGEVTADTPTIDEKLAIIEWHVELANKKASWHRFEGAQRVANILRNFGGTVAGLASGGAAAASERIEATGRRDRRRGRSTSPVGTTVAEDRVTSAVAVAAAAIRDVDSEDIPPRRNLSVTGEQRSKLDITPPAQKIEGVDRPPVRFVGEFSFKESTEEVYLGEIRTDEKGRLLVLGGHGKADSLKEDNPLLRHYANNDGWYDDISDGPVMAIVHIDGKPVEVRGSAHVIVAPPHYSPATKSVVTLYDEMLQTLIDNPQVPWPHEFGAKPSLDQPVSFIRDIYPILNSLSLYEWVSVKAYRGHSSGSGRGDTGAGLMDMLSNPRIAAQSASVHKHIFSRIRKPVRHAFSPPGELMVGRLEPHHSDAIIQANLHFMPPLAGDESGEVSTGNAKTWLSVTPLQYVCLEKWSRGEFENDWEQPRRDVFPPRSLEAEAVELQPFLLTRAVLQSAQGGAYLPGIEITSISRDARFYSEAFRPYRNLDPRPVLDHHQVSYGPGDITKWMAVPWQADFYDCASHWWPTIRPDDVVPLDEFERIVANGDAESSFSSMLTIRKPWDRGLGKQLVPQPNIPAVNRGETRGSYRQRVANRIKAYANAFLAGAFAYGGGLYPKDSASGNITDVDEYIKTVKRYLKYHISEGSDFVPPPAERHESLFNYSMRVKQHLKKHLYEVIERAFPGADSEEVATSGYALDIAKAVAISSHCQGLIDFEWRVRHAHAAQYDFSKRWSEMGIVVPKPGRNGETVYIETERGKYDLLNWRDYFYILMNEARYPDFGPKAKELAEDYFEQGRELIAKLSSDPNMAHYAPFEYSWPAFEARMKRIYRLKKIEAEEDIRNGHPLYNSEKRVRERILQMAPFNQTDGAWLRNIAQPGPLAHVRALLTEIWIDEIGLGNPAANHANVYTALLQRVGIYLPPVNSREYADNPDIWDESYQAAVRQYCVSKFTEEYFPEILGMTLQLEWEANGLVAQVKMCTDFGIPPDFYNLHIGIDNAADGHGAKAMQAIKLFLDAHPYDTQQLWERIWVGYISFGMVGDMDWEYKLTHPSTLSERMVMMIERKKPFSQLNHGDKKLDQNTLNQWMDEPEKFLEALEQSQFIIKGNAAESPIMRLMSLSGPMYQVFTPAERQLWIDWINSLEEEPVDVVVPQVLPPAEAFALLLRKMRSATVATEGHTSHYLSGPNPDQAGMTQITKPLVWWFSQRDPMWIMRALREAPEWVSPGNVAGSRLISDFVRASRPMGRTLTQQIIHEASGKTAAQVIEDWIAAECPLPEPMAPAVSSSPKLMLFAAALNRSRPEEGTLLGETRPAEPIRAQDREIIKRRFYGGPGGGAVH